VSSCFVSLEELRGTAYQKCRDLNPGATLLLVPSVEPLWPMCERGRCASARRRTGTGHVFQAQRVRRILESYQCENEYELVRRGWLRTYVLGKNIPSYFFFSGRVNFL
jgi:hypothetical protein